MKTPLTFLLSITFLLSFVLLIGFPKFSSAQSVNYTVKVADYFGDIKIKIVLLKFVEMLVKYSSLDEMQKMGRVA
jgi:hypothetical protein